MDALVGHTGFVGGNLARQHEFGAFFNSSNIADIAGCEFDTLVCTAVPATMWLANENPDADRANILKLFERLRSARAENFVLVSTIAVFRDPSQPVDEASDDFETVLAYGRHRRELEELVQESFRNSLILRLPALFGDGLKKNFLFDILNPVPSFLKPDRFAGLLAVAPDSVQQTMRRAFQPDEASGMWRFDRGRYGNGQPGNDLARFFHEQSASAVGFTHADSMFQFYCLGWLWRDICRAQGAGLEVLNLATRPLRAGDLHLALTGKEMNVRKATRIMQDMRSRHCDLWSRDDGYLYGGEEVLESMKRFFRTSEAQGR